jgi:hypothetical protein
MVLSSVKVPMRVLGGKLVAGLPPDYEFFVTAVPQCLQKQTKTLIFYMKLLNIPTLFPHSAVDLIV